MPTVSDALLSLYRPSVGQSFPTWIDSICINQEVNVEKERQVLEMNYICGLAPKVIVWVGTAVHGRDIMLDKIQILFATFTSTLDHIGPAGFEGPGIPDKSVRSWPAIGYLFRRAWYGQLWVFQEVVLAKNIMVGCSCKYVDWEHMSVVDLAVRQLGLLDMVLRSRPS